MGWVYFVEDVCSLLGILKAHNFFFGNQCFVFGYCTKDKQGLIFVRGIC